MAISINSSESEGKKHKPTPLPHMRLWFLQKRRLKRIYIQRNHCRRFKKLKIMFRMESKFRLLNILCFL